MNFLAKVVRSNSEVEQVAQCPSVILPTNVFQCILCKVSIVVGGCKLLLVLCLQLVIAITPLMLFQSDAHAEINLNILAQIESSNNPHAVGDQGSSIGLYQISEIALRDFNQFHPTERVKQEQLFNPQINERVARWMVSERIPQLLRHFKVEVNNKNIIWTFNCGIGCVVDGHTPPLTVRYFKKYQMLGGVL